jgi:ParB family chromosome partitioning protein
LRPNPHQPRKAFGPEALDELVQSIKQHGILQPIVVRPSGDTYEIIAGERRWRAAQLANLSEVPVVVRPSVSDAEMLELALVENVQRDDLNAIERAEGFRDLMASLHLTQEQVAQKVGLRRATVANHLRLLDLPPTVQDAVRHGLISMGHARALLGSADATAAIELMQRVARKGLSVRQVEEAVRAKGKARELPATKASEPAWISHLESRLREQLGSKVELRNGPKYRGQITIHYFGRDDLERLIALLAPPAKL